MGTAHRAEMGTLCAFRRESFIMKLSSRVRIEREIELVFPSELESCFRDRVVAVLGAGVTFGKVGSVGGDLVCDYAVFDVFFVRQTEMFFRGDVTQHGATVPADH